MSAVTDARPMRGWTIEATCPRCGGILGHVADGRPDGLTSRAIARCTACRAEYGVTVTIASFAAAIAHRRGDTPHHPTCPCNGCQLRRDRQAREAS